MKYAAILLAGLFATGAAADDIQKMKASGSVAEAMDRLEAAVTGAGATVFARVDHGAGARKAGMELGDSQLLIFGNPKLGTPVMQQDMLTGLVLPLKMLVYADGTGQTWVAYEDVEELTDDFDVDDDLPVLEMIEGALKKFANAAAGG